MLKGRKTEQERIFLGERSVPFFPKTVNFTEITEERTMLKKCGCGKNQTWCSEIIFIIFDT